MHPLHFKFWGYPIFRVVEVRTLREWFGLPDVLDARSGLLGFGSERLIDSKRNRYHGENLRTARNEARRLREGGVSVASS